MVFSIFFCTFVKYKRGGFDHELTLFIHLLKHTIMNKTVKTVLKVLGYIIAALLGAAGEAVMM